MHEPIRRRAALLSVILLEACTVTTRPDTTAGRRTIYDDPGTMGAVAGIGIESQDLLGMTDRMMRDMLADSTLANRERPPRVIVDSEYFYNEGASRLNKNTITDRLRVDLNRAAAGRMVFVGRHYADMVESERSLKRDGTVDRGSKSMTAAAAGGDYRLGGRITSLDAVDAKSGLTSRYHQIVFEMVDLEAGVIAWSGIYELRKTAADDVIYR